MKLNNYFLYTLILLFLFVLFYKNKPYKPSPLILKLKYKLGLINSKFLNYDIRESKDSSYTENKSIIYICTKDPKTQQYYDDNILLYVCLHECAHCLSIDYGHHEEFNKILKSLTEKATILGIYDPTVKIPSDYCGLKN